MATDYHAVIQENIRKNDECVRCGNYIYNLSITLGSYKQI